MAARRRLWDGRPCGADPFALPRGPVGRLAGAVMARENRVQNTEALLYAAPGPGEDVLEVGHGPGVLLGLLAARAGTVTGVDPSPEMARMARRRNAAAVRDGRVRLRPGDAARTGAPDASFDLVVSVNTVALWPRLEPAAAELRRVLRPGGRLLLFWHLRPRGFALSPAERGTVAAALRAGFGEVRTADLRHSVVFAARP
ncbi:class I SAM-dependent methyltransferase [Nocardiopsis composta]|uniref:SAM-dependent methyltransferase n=1 Tax=Nocardiopsis composta TaxID=157465 RepID=A0A7W8QTB0_9ACTN|nr:class I SAM-dependent methyltransferase [Nocardiopsis composta]MBB5435558.1 SAM-dependent methyltransferase [Nocardiopsis composta]